MRALEVRSEPFCRATVSFEYSGGYIVLHNIYVRLIVKIKRNLLWA